MNHKKKVVQRKRPSQERSDSDVSNAMVIFALVADQGKLETMDIKVYPCLTMLTIKNGKKR